MSRTDEIHVPESRQVMLYESHDHTVHLDVHVDSDTVWLTQQQLATLFGRSVPTISRHIANAQREELEGISVVAKYATTAPDGKTYQVDYYNLDMILRRIPRQIQGRHILPPLGEHGAQTALGTGIHRQPATLRSLELHRQNITALSKS